VLVVGEGPTEKAFLTHLRGLFLGRDAGVTIKVESADGGDPAMVIHRAKRLLQLGQYDKCVIVMDTDRPWPALHPKIQGAPADYIKESPCVEAILLDVLGQPRPTSTSIAKAKFHQVIPENRKTTADAYASRFTKDLLLGRRSAVPELDRMIKIMEQGVAP
jgi:hypothetical protein